MGTEKNRAFYILVLFSVLGHYSFSFLFPMLMLLLSSLGGLNSNESLLLMAGAFFVSGIFMPITGRQIDAGNYSIILTFGAIGTLVGIAGFLSLGGCYFGLLATTIFFLIGLGVLQTASSAFLESGVSIAYRSSAALTLASVANLGFVLSSLIAYFFIANHKSLLLKLDAATSILYFAALFVALKFTKKSNSDFNNSQKAREEKSEKPYFYNLPWRKLFGSFLLSLTLCTQFTAIPQLYRANGLDTERHQAIIIGISALSVTIVGGILATNVIFQSSRSKLLLASILTCIGQSIVPLVNSNATNIVATLIWSLGEAFIYPVTAIVIFNHFPQDESGRAASIRSIVLRLCMVLVPLLTIVLSYLPSAAFSLIFGSVPLIAAYLLWPATQWTSKEHCIQI